MIFFRLLLILALLHSNLNFASHCNLLDRYESNVPIDGNWNLGETRYYPDIKCKAKKCLTIKEAVVMALNRSFESKKSFITVFQSQLNIISKLSNLIPSLEISLGGGQYPINIFETLSYLIGFLIPSNWFDWFESIYLYKAQAYLYIHTLINLAITTQMIFYIYHLNIIDYFIVKYYHQNLFELVQHVDLAPNVYKVSEEDYLRLKQYIIELEIQMLEIKQTLEQEIGNFAFTLNYQGDWHELGLEMFNHPKEKHEYIEVDDWINTGLKNSNYLVAIKYQILAARFARFSRLFSFFSIQQDNTIGLKFSLSYVSDLLISSTEVSKLKTEYQEAEQEIRMNLWQDGHNYNTSIDIQEKYEEAKFINMQLLDIILQKFHHENVIARTHILSGIPSAIRFERGINQMIHLRYISEIEYALLSDQMTKPYEIPSKIPKRKVPTRQSHFKKWQEDQDILKARDFRDFESEDIFNIQ